MDVINMKQTKTNKIRQKILSYKGWNMLGDNEFIAIINELKKQYTKNHILMLEKKYAVFKSEPTYHLAKAPYVAVLHKRSNNFEREFIPPITNDKIKNIRTFNVTLTDNLVYEMRLKSEEREYYVVFKGELLPFREDGILQMLTHPNQKTIDEYAFCSMCFESIPKCSCRKDKELLLLSRH